MLLLQAMIKCIIGHSRQSLISNPDCLHYRALRARDDFGMVIVLDLGLPTPGSAGDLQAPSLVPTPTGQRPPWLKAL